MPQLDYIHDLTLFTALRSRANAGIQMLADKPRDELLYFDPIDIATQKFFDLVQVLLAFEGRSDFATVILKPDPFNYFHHHFGKYPGLVHRRENSDEEFFHLMMQDPGDSPADALGVNHEHYAILPVVGDWIAFGDRSWDVGVFYGPPDIMECARNFYPFFNYPCPEGFRIEP
jgi:hypothetical protein